MKARGRLLVGLMTLCAATFPSLGNADTTPACGPSTLTFTPRVRAGAGSQSAVEVDGAGTISVVLNDVGIGPGTNVRLGPRLVRSTDGGATFSPPAGLAGATTTVAQGFGAPDLALGGGDWVHFVDPYVADAHYHRLSPLGDADVYRPVIPTPGVIDAMQMAVRRDALLLDDVYLLTRSPGASG